MRRQTKELLLNDVQDLLTYYFETAEAQGGLDFEELDQHMTRLQSIYNRANEEEQTYAE